jgi:uncharacterized membrane protein
VTEGAPVQVQSLTDAIGWSWRFLWKKPEAILVIFVAGLCGQAIALPGTIAGTVMEASGGRDAQTLGLLVRAGTGVLNFPLSVFFAMGVARYVLNLARGAPAGFKDIFSWGPYFPYLGAAVLIGIGCAFGLLFCLVPGIFLAICWMFTGLAIVDRDLGPIEAMGRSWDLTKGHRWDLLLFLLLCFGVNLLGLLACCVGLIFTSAMTQIAVAWVYLRLSGQEPVAA